jgi:Rv0078B-related antitoxin
MDPLRKDDLDRARRTPIEERARQTLEMMAMGIRLQRMALRRRFPEATEDEIERRMRAWLARDD